LLTRTEIIIDALSKHDDPDMRYFTQVELDAWLNDTILDVAEECGYERTVLSVLGSTNIAALGTTPRFFELPSTVIHISDAGILVNGIARIGTSEREINLLSQKAAGYISDTFTSVSAIITLDDYFDESLYPEINHYWVDWYVKSVTDSTGAVIYSMATGGTGRLMCFAPDVADTDIITMNLICLPDLTTTGTTTTGVARQHDEALKHGLALRMVPKALSKQLCDINTARMYAEFYASAKAKIKKELIGKIPDKHYRMKGPRELGLYNSRRYAITGATGGASE
jgi:hypothetical protein